MPKKSSSRKKKSGSINPVIVAIMVILILAGVYFIWSYTGKPDTPPARIITELEGITDPAEFDRLLPRLIEQNELPADIQNALPEGMSMLYFDEDITGDGYREFVLVRAHDQFSGTASEVGYEKQISEMRVYRVNGDSSTLLLQITRDSIINESGDRLIEQIPADHGYAFRVYSFFEDPYTQPVRVFEVAIADEDGNLISDDLTIYWHPDERKYKATNMFGAPGTF